MYLFKQVNKAPIFKISQAWFFQRNGFVPFVLTMHSDCNPTS